MDTIDLDASKKRYQISCLVLQSLILCLSPQLFIIGSSIDKYIKYTLIFFPIILLFFISDRIAVNLFVWSGLKSKAHLHISEYPIKNKIISYISLILATCGFVIIFILSMKGGF